MASSHSVRHLFSPSKDRAKKLILRIVIFNASLFLGAAFVKIVGDHFASRLVGFRQGNMRRLSSILALEWVMCHLTFIMYRHLFTHPSVSSKFAIKRRDERFRLYCFVLFSTMVSLAHLTYFFYLIESFEIPWILYDISAICNGIWINLCPICFLFTFYNLCLQISTSFATGQWVIRRIFVVKAVKMFSLDHRFQIGLTFLLTLLLSISHWYYSDKLYVKHQKIYTERNSETALSLKMVVLTDLHAGASVYGKQISSVVKRVNSLDADVVFLIGDIVDAPRKLIEERVESLRHLKAQLGTFYVTGNHEYYYGNAEEWFALFESYGIRVLKNDVVKLNGYCLIGLNDITSEESGIPNHVMDVSVINYCPKNATTIVLAHNPSAARKIFEFSQSNDHPVDLILSGHTHNAQYLVLMPFAYFILPYLYGLYVLSDGATKLFVSAGTLFQNAPMKIPFIWRNDTNAFGKRMMEQMGWRDGLGLGKNAEGIRENVKPNANHTQRGFGFSGGTRESNWDCHDDEFSNILAKLNEDKSAKGSEKEEKGQSNLEGPINVKKSERSSVLNIRRKRRPNLSFEDKTAIFGKPAPKLSNISYKAQNNAEKREATQKQLAENLLLSSITMDEYFAQKKEKKRKRNVKT
ncbi:hypothetical protein niasHS_017701 [Heterodera schachtii]|uniref:G-patch domain-containing protein n=1 Tax=Heterodera schachtii TaxID=97005 RepID=A0ABD2HXT2_HETSC